MKIHRHTPPQSEIHADPRRALSIRLSRLLNEMQQGCDALTTLSEAHAMLEAIPLATDEFALARNRLHSAHRYLRSNESGAAAYELRLVLGQLRERSALEPRRRTR